MKHVINIADKSTLDETRDNTATTLEEISSNTEEIKQEVKNNTNGINSNVNEKISDLNDLIGALQTVADTIKTQVVTSSVVTDGAKTLNQLVRKITPDVNANTDSKITTTNTLITNLQSTINTLKTTVNQIQMATGAGDPGTLVKTDTTEILREVESISNTLKSIEGVIDTTDCASFGGNTLNVALDDIYSDITSLLRSISNTLDMTDSSSFGGGNLEDALEDIYSNTQEAIRDIINVSGMMENQQKKLVDVDDNISDVKTTINNMTPLKRYGIRIKKGSDKTSTLNGLDVEYTYDAIGFTPAGMSYDSSTYKGTFSYGSWKDIWFVKNNRPVMLDACGNILAFLDPDNYQSTVDDDGNPVVVTGKVDGVDADAMSMIPLVWVSFTEDTDYQYITVCSEKYDETYKAIAHTKEDGTVVPNIFLSMYKIMSENQAQFYSRSGAAPWITYSGRNNNDNNKSGANHVLVGTCRLIDDGAPMERWSGRTWFQYQLIYALLMIMGKTTNIKQAFGHGMVGVCHLPVVLPDLKTGMLDDCGQFAGYNRGCIEIQHTTSYNIYPTKVFHMENFWGMGAERIGGIVVTPSHSIKISEKGVGYTDYTSYENVGRKAANASQSITVCNNQVGRLPVRSYPNEIGVCCYDFQSVGNGSESIGCVLIGGGLEQGARGNGVNGISSDGPMSLMSYCVDIGENIVCQGLSFV